MKKIRQRQVLVRFTCSKEECATIHELAGKTTCRSFSEYARKMLMAVPVAVTIRNRSLDDLIDVLSEIYTVLEGQIGKTHWTAKEREEMQSVLKTITTTVYKIIEQCIQD